MSAKAAKDAEWIEEWARDYAALGVLGFLFSTLVLGKVLHDILLVRGKVCGVAVVPASVMGGLVGTFWFISMGHMDESMASDLNAGLSMVKSNLVNFVFSAFILGLTCTRTSSQHFSGLKPLLKSVFHEGMPMVLYSQIVIWGQSAICIFLRLGWKLAGDRSNPTLISAMVPLGMESGPDVVPPVVFHSDWSQLVVQEAESYSALLIVVLGAVFLSLKGYFIERGWVADGDQSVQDDSEFFRKADKNGITRAVSTPDLAARQRTGAWTTSNHFENDETEPLMDKVPPKEKRNLASFGTHVSIVFLTAFSSFVFGLFGRLFESKYPFFENHNFISGFCLFEVSMCCAFVVMHVLLRHTRIVFDRDWFMRVCGIMLDLLVVAALSSAGYFPSTHALPSYTAEIIVMIIVCAIWNVAFLFLMGQHMFPNFWFDRSVVLMGDSMGHAFIGLLFARCLDPTMETPVPAAFAYKLMFIFLPTSAGKNSLVFTMVNSMGLALSFVVCLVVMCGWYYIFHVFFRPRFIQKKSEPADSGAHSLNETSPPRRLSVAAELLATADEVRQTGMPLVLGDASALLALSPTGDKIITTGPKTPQPDSISVSDNFVTFQQKSLMLNGTNLKLVASWLPAYYSLSSWRLAFSLRRDGANLSTLLAKCSARKSGGGIPNASNSTSFIILVEDSWGYVFGGFISHSLVNCNEYYGSGENFVFSVMPVAEKYKWAGENDLFVVSSPSNFAMGGAGEGFAFQLDDELATGVSNRSQTYNNEVLSSNEFFKCLNVEVWELSSAK